MEEEDEEPIPTESYESEAAAQAAAEQQLPILAEARVPVQRHLEPAIQAAAAADLTATTEGVLAGWGALFGFVPARVSASSHQITSALSFISERHIRSFRLVSSQVSVLEEASTVAEPAAASALVILPGRGDTTVAIPCEPIPRYPGDLRPSKRPRPFYLGKTQVNPGACVAEPATSSYFVAGEVLRTRKHRQMGASAWQLWQERCRAERANVQRHLHGPSSPSRWSCSQVQAEVLQQKV
jgi:hypothetical protein